MDLTTNFSLDLNSGLTQALADGQAGSPAESMYLYGRGRGLTRSDQNSLARSPKIGK